MMRRTAVISMLVVLVLLTGCDSTERDSLRQQVQSLQAQVGSMEQQQHTLQAEMRDARAENRQLRSCIGVVADVSRSLAADVRFLASDQALGGSLLYFPAGRCAAALGTRATQHLKAMVHASDQTVNRVSRDRIFGSAPIQPSGATPTNVTAICNDGTYSYSQHASGTCSWHGGVRTWVNYPGN
jgi:outer membrane murein-binding lipoprotein Lpp